jgi:hypothetical protein
MTIALTDTGLVPAGTDIAEVLSSVHEKYLVAVIYTYRQRQSSRDTLAHASDLPASTRAYIEKELDTLADPSPIEALTANAKLVELLTGRRWILMEEARERGESWSTIGAALGMSKQGALDWYRRKIDFQDKHASGFHDADRARSALAD